MSTQGFDSFKPLSEDEEKQVKGGGYQPVSQQCGQILQEMHMLQEKIQIIQQQGGVPDQSLIQTLNQCQLQYQQCVANNQQQNP